MSKVKVPAWHGPTSFHDILGPSYEEAEMGVQPPAPSVSRSMLLLDFDGTIIDLQTGNSSPTVSRGLRSTLDHLVELTGGAIAVISGRGVSELATLLPDFHGVLVGGLGREVQFKDGITIEDLTASDPAREFATLMRSLAYHLEGVEYEERPGSGRLCFDSAPGFMVTCQQILSKIVARDPELTLRHERRSLEIIPEGLSKRRVAVRMVRKWSDRVPIALGDDCADEGMFAVCAECGGFGVKVGDGPTHAPYRVLDVAACHDMLAKWARRCVPESGGRADSFSAGELESRRNSGFPRSKGNGL